MPLGFKIFFLAIALRTLVLSCPLARTYDLTFFVTSSTNDMIACGSNAAVNAVITYYSISGPPILPAIWDTYTSNSVYHCTMTKYFFVPGRPTGALVDVFTDDYTTMKINDVQVSTISTNSICSFQKDKDVFSYIKPGLNSLYIDANNAGGAGYFGYRLTIKTQLA
ncbi:hypothetical protein SteCoe_7788 [Stentor coeruleus]|uniref:CUB domain-containing protein n=1 Tax=Stentor coeruleus TaxID=5963 RepID=A0A1R2CLV6_9CILI|nr:hypothetical protein SteCoe_7788 [Stentor coeruleus]